MLYSYIFNKYCAGTTVYLQNIIKQWPILCLLPMCSTDTSIIIIADPVADIIVGVIESVGPDVTKYKPGDSVFTVRSVTGRNVLIGGFTPFTFMALAHCD